MPRHTSDTHSPLTSRTAEQRKAIIIEKARQYYLHKATELQQVLTNAVKKEKLPEKGYSLSETIEGSDYLIHEGQTMFELSEFLTHFKSDRKRKNIEEDEIYADRQRKDIEDGHDGVRKEPYLEEIENLYNTTHSKLFDEYLEIVKNVNGLDLSIKTTIPAYNPLNSSPRYHMQESDAYRKSH